MILITIAASAVLLALSRDFPAVFGAEVLPAPLSARLSQPSAWVLSGAARCPAGSAATNASMRLEPR